MSSGSDAEGSNGLFVVSDRVRNKSIVYLRTHTGRFYDITDCRPVTDNKFGIHYNGVLNNAKPISAESVANLLATYNAEEYHHVRLSKGKTKSKIKRQERQLTKEVI